MGNPSSVPKTKNPKVIKDLRKISCTSDYSKLFERFLKTWILEDIQADLDLVQFGNQKGPNIAIQKFSTIGVRASINQLLASYHQGRYDGEVQWNYFFHLPHAWRRSPRNPAGSP